MGTAPLIAAIGFRLAEEHRGEINLESNAGQGTVVRIELPRRQTRRDHRSDASPVR